MKTNKAKKKKKKNPKVTNLPPICFEVGRPDPPLGKCIDDELLNFTEEKPWTDPPTYVAVVECLNCGVTGKHSFTRGIEISKAFCQTCACKTLALKRIL